MTTRTIDTPAYYIVSPDNDGTMKFAVAAAGTNIQPDDLVTMSAEQAASLAFKILAILTRTGYDFQAVRR